MPPTISKSRFITAQHCSRRLWLETHMRDEAAPSEGSAIVWGNRIGELARTLRPEGRFIGDQDRFDLALAETQTALEGAGDVVLFEPAFSAGGMAVRCDILERHAGRYTLTEVKSATTARESHVQDVAYQIATLGAAGITVERARLQLIDNSFVYQGGGDYRGLFRIEDLTSDVLRVLPQIPERLGNYQRVLEGPEPEMARGPHCKKPWECGYQARCSVGEAEYPISVLPLQNAGFLEAAAAHGWRDVRDVPESYVNKPAAHRIWQATVSGQASLTEEAVATLGSARPRMQYLDFETWAPAIPRWRGTRPYQQLPFQWSLHTDHGAGEIQHDEFLDDTGEFPVRKAAEALIAATSCAYPIAVYTGFEHNTIGTMIVLCPDLEGALRTLQQRLVDLHPLAKESYYHRDMQGSWSMKKLLPTIAPELDYKNLGEVQEGGGAVSAYEEIIEPGTSPERKAALVQDLKRYCRRDTEAMIAVVRRLGSARSALETSTRRQIGGAMPSSETRS